MRCPGSWIAVVALAAFGCTSAGPAPPVDTSIGTWSQGLTVQSRRNPANRMFLWVYEWNLFGAVQPVEYSEAPYVRGVVRDDGASGVVVHPNLRLEMTAVGGGADLRLEITNDSDRAWGELATVIPCLNPGQGPRTNKRFTNQKTWFLGEPGLLRLGLESPREIHFNAAFAERIPAEAPPPDPARSHPVDWRTKWPPSDVPATRGLLLRESRRPGWVTGIAWERFLTVQGHNPWRCMHLGVRVGPLAPGETRVIRGKLYLMRGGRQELVYAYARDFGGL